MSIRAKYQITFQMITTPNGNNRPMAISATKDNSALASHLTFSSFFETTDQIESINNAVSGYNGGLPFDDL